MNKKQPEPNKYQKAKQSFQKDLLTTTVLDKLPPKCFTPFLAYFEPKEKI